MSDLTGLPASAIARAAALANINAVAVKILLPLPGGLDNNPKPVNLSGIVQGQNPDGSVKLQTDRGVINIMMKDKGALPVGQKIDIDIPAGRPPQQAAIRPLPSTPITQTPAPPPASSILTAAVTAPPVKLDRSTNLRPDDLAEALSSIPIEEGIPIAAPLQVGQTLRLTPTQTPLNLPADLQILKPEALFSFLLQAIEQAADLPQETKQNLIKILSNVDINSLLSNLPEENGTINKTQITQTFQKLVQALELPESLKLRNATSSVLPAPVFNPAKPLDIKILAFPNTSFQTTLESVTTRPQAAVPGTPVIDLKNFVVVPQTPPSPQAVTVPMPVPDFPEGTNFPLPPGTVATVPPTTPINTNTTQALPASPPQVPTQTPTQPQPQAVPAGNLPSSAQIQAPTQNQPQPQPASLLGQVVSFTPSGQPVISLSLPGSTQPQNFVMQFVPNNISVGAPVIVSPLPAILPKTSFVPFALGNAIPLPEWATPSTWESLQSLITTVGHYSPALAQSMIQNLPNAAQPQNLGALATLFVAMLRNGQIDEWIGDSASNLLKQTGKIDILRALAGDSAMTTKLENAPLPNEWRATIFPFWHDNQVHKLPLYYKNWRDESDEAQDTRKKTRFMFELKLSRMGQVQVDGFMSREKLDMILRTRSPVGVNMQEALRKLYYKAMDRSNLSGEITFQFKPEQWVNVEIPA